MDRGGPDARPHVAAVPAPAVPLHRQADHPLRARRPGQVDHRGRDRGGPADRQVRHPRVGRDAPGPRDDPRLGGRARGLERCHRQGLRRDGHGAAGDHLPDLPGAARGADPRHHRAGPAHGHRPRHRGQRRGRDALAPGGRFRRPGEAVLRRPAPDPLRRARDRPCDQGAGRARRQRWAHRERHEVQPGPHDVGAGRLREARRGRHAPPGAAEPQEPARPGARGHGRGDAPRRRHDQAVGRDLPPGAGAQEAVRRGAVGAAPRSPLGPRAHDDHRDGGRHRTLREGPDPAPRGRHAAPHRRVRHPRQGAAGPPLVRHRRGHRRPRGGPDHRLPGGLRCTAGGT